MEELVEVSVELAVWELAADTLRGITVENWDWYWVFFNTKVLAVAEYLLVLVLILNVERENGG